MKKQLLFPTRDDVGKRMDIFLAEKLEMTRSQIKVLIDNGKVFLNNQAVKKNGQEIRLGEIRVEILPLKLISTAPEDLPIDIVYQDNDIAVINKTQGMVTHPAKGSPNSTLVNAVLYHIKDLSQINGDFRPGIVHRLDKDTSGLIIVAKNNKAHLSLANQLSKRTMKRFYLALVNGNIKEDKGTINFPIARHKTNRKVMSVQQIGKEALTYFKVMERFVHYTFVEFELFTGRTHQIRVHAKHIHHPIVGDKVYGIKSNKFELNGQLLHAYKLQFEHPTTKNTMIIESDLPCYFQKILNDLRDKYKE